MSLPILISIEDCAKYSKGVEPFIPQLYELPHKVLENIGSFHGLKQVYMAANPLVTGFAASLVLGFVFLVVSEVNRNYSQVDRMWSILPNLYVVHIAVWARLAGMPHSRLDLMAAASTLWSIRLTFNYYRKGGYNVGSEDYRWAILQQYVPKVVWFIFNVTFISFIQSILLFAFSCAPAYVVLLTTKFEPDITANDVAFLVVEVALVVTEYISDGQMWNYQTAKYKYKDDGVVPAGYSKQELDRGFITTGLFAYSRHPNFFAEQLVWFVLYQWSCFASKTLYNWAGIGSGSLFLLFQGSTWLTELITADKYPQYNDYQKRVGMFTPKSLTAYQPPAQEIKKKQ